MSVRSDIRRVRHRTLERLLALRDEAKLQLHLLDLDAQRAFAELETKIAALETRLSREGEHVAEALKGTSHDLTRALDELLTGRVNGATGMLTSVRALMTTPARSCRVGDSLNEAACLLWSVDCGMIPVLADDHVVGVVTDRDICMATYTQGKRPAAIGVEVAMSKQVFSCSPDDSLSHALAIMSDHRVRRLPVVSHEGKLLGVLSLSDIVRWAGPLTSPAIDAAITETLAAISASTPAKGAIAAE